MQYSKILFVTLVTMLASMPSGVVAETTSYNKTFVNRSGEEVAVMQLLPGSQQPSVLFYLSPKQTQQYTATVPDLGGFFFFDSTRNPRVMDAQAKLSISAAPGKNSKITIEYNPRRNDRRQAIFQVSESKA